MNAKDTASFVQDSFLPTQNQTLALIKRQTLIESLSVMINHWPAFIMQTGADSGPHNKIDLLRVCIGSILGPANRRSSAYSSSLNNQQIEF